MSLMLLIIIYCSSVHVFFLLLALRWLGRDYSREQRCLYCECLVIKTEDDTETGLLFGSNGKIVFALVNCSVNSSNAISVLPQSKYVIQSLMMLI